MLFLCVLERFRRWRLGDVRLGRRLGSFGLLSWLLLNALRVLSKSDAPRHDARIPRLHFALDLRRHERILEDLGFVSSLLDEESVTLVAG